MNIDTARAVADGDPRVHGNGFIQLDLKNGNRMNVWGHPRIPSQVTRSQIHDHRFSFTSVVILGCMVNVEWIERDDGVLYDVYKPVPRIQHDNELERVGEVRIKVCSTRVVLPGDMYVQPWWMFHETFVNQPTVTVMRKDRVQEDYVPRILCKPEYGPDNTFDRHGYAVADLWDIINEVIGEK